MVNREVVCPRWTTFSYTAASSFVPIIERFQASLDLHRPLEAKCSGMSQPENYRHGFLYPLYCALIGFLAHINVVELFKAVGRRLSPETGVRVAIDIFVMSKWLIVLYLWGTHASGAVAIAIVLYLIGTNFFTFFYYHVWNDPYDPTDDGYRSRFMMLMTSIAFNAACFAFLYDVPFSAHFTTVEAFSHTGASVLMSIARTVFVDTAPMMPITAIGYVLTLGQTVLMFMFISVILSASLVKRTTTNNN